MITYKSHKTPTEAKEYFNMLKELGENNWTWQQDKYGISIFYKKVTGKIDRANKEVIKTPEWLEFFNTYKKIKNNGLSNDSLIIKYNKLVSEGLHQTIMDNLKDYKLYLDVKKKLDFALMASTYINQARYKDKWETVEDLSKKWINDIYKDKKLTAYEIQNMNTEIEAWEVKMKQEIRSGVVRNMIETLLNK